MANVEINKLSKDDKDELVCTYAALLLHDSKLNITGDKLGQVIKSSGNEVEAYWPGLFAKALVGHDIDELITNIGGNATAPVAGVRAKAEVADVDDKEVDKSVESEVDMGNIFDDY